MSAVGRRRGHAPSGSRSAHRGRCRLQSHGSAGRIFPTEVWKRHVRILVLRHLMRRTLRVPLKQLRASKWNRVAARCTALTLLFFSSGLVFLDGSLIRSFSSFASNCLKHFTHLTVKFSKIGNLPENHYFCTLFVAQKRALAASLRSAIRMFRSKESSSSEFHSKRMLAPIRALLSVTLRWENIYAIFHKRIHRKLSLC